MKLPSTLINLSISTISLLLSLIAIEICLRISGLRPWEWQSKSNNMPLMSTYDPEIGWINRPGIYNYSHFDKHISVKISEDGSRGSSLSKNERHNVWFFGCSFTFGWGVADGFDYPTRVAMATPSIAVKNFAVPGYATLQSNLLYKRVTKKTDKHPDLVVYGFGDFHGHRNVAARSWLKKLRAAEKTHEWISTPYARLDDKGNLFTSPPVSFHRWPYSEHSSLIQQLQEGIAYFSDHEHKKEQAIVTLRLIENWNREVKNDGKIFTVFLLQLGEKDKKFYIDGFNSSNIEYISCNEISFPSAEFYINSRDGHPNEAANQLWAQCFNDWLKEKNYLTAH